MATTNNWSSGLADICKDCGICCFALYCAPCLYGDIVAKTNGTDCCGPCCLYAFCPLCACCFASSNRKVMRAKYNLPEEPCGDFMVHLCCGVCALCQEAREIQFRLTQR